MSALERRPAGSSRAFLPDLRRIEADLPMPLPDRVRILRELEYDLEQLRDGLVSRGMAMDEARRRALEALLPGRTALGELGRLHTPLYRRVTRSLGVHRLRVAERSALALATASVLFVEAAILVQEDLFEDPSPFLWPVLGMGAVLFAACAAKGFQLWIKRDHRRPERRLGAILGLSGVILVTGICGAVADLYRLAGILEAEPSLAGILTLHWLVRSCVLLSVSLLISLAGSLAWFVLTRWVWLVSGARREVLGLDPPTPSRRK
ncbi:MAG TPA: hypothetical protein VE173_07860 [Longimicrobiales bacterium]|jgi:hypothetical protein|nr:hypothetical protein [Longimicrobiales bacterium]